MKITLLVSIALLAIGLSAEDKPVPPPPTVESLKTEIAYLRSFIKELETRQKYAEIVCSQPDMLKAKQDTIEAEKKMQAATAPKENK